MGELGIDITGHVSRRITDVVLTHPELVVTLSPEAQHTVIELTRVAEWDVEYWPTPDPSVAEGHREIILAAYRDLRNYLQMRIAERFAIPPGQA